jgi:hypothetical protein
LFHRFNKFITILPFFKILVYLFFTTFSYIDQTPGSVLVAEVRDDGFREVLEVRLADSEDSLFWQDLFEDLKERGLKGVKLIVSDGHKGIQKVVRESFIGSSWQMCHVHLIRQILMKILPSLSHLLTVRAGYVKNVTWKRESVSIQIWQEFLNMLSGSIGRKRLRNQVCLWNFLLKGSLNQCLFY